MNVDELEGRELDIKVAELMGWHGIVDYERVTTHDGEKVSRTFGKVGFQPLQAETRRVSIPGFSTSVASVFQVVEKMRRNGWWPCLDWDGDDELWHVKFFSPSKEAVYRARASKIELAICRAALKAVEGT